MSKMIFWSACFSFLVLALSLKAQSPSAEPPAQGYIIRKTDDGILKIPKGQTFRFDGSGIEAGVDRPGQSILGRRPEPMRSTLIPSRKSFRDEAMRDAGFGGGQ